MSLKSLATILGCAALGALALAGPAAAGGSIRIDAQAPTPITTCTLGVACANYQTTSYFFILPDGTMTNRLYVYDEGIVGLGSEVAGTPGGAVTSSGYYAAAAFATIPDLEDVTRTNMAFPDAAVFTYHTGAANTGGMFQILFTDMRTDLDAPGNFMQLEFKYGGYLFDADGYGARPGSGLPQGFAPNNAITQFAICTTGVCQDTMVRGSTPISAAPEPASWAMMIAGFGMAGGILRRRRQALA